MGHQRANKALHLTAIPLRSIAAGERRIRVRLDLKSMPVIIIRI